ADRPVDAEPVPRVRREVEVAPAVHLPAPHDRLAADLAGADPVERFGGIEGVGVVAVVDEEFAAVLVAGVAMALDELIALERLAVAEAPELHRPRRHVLDVIPGGIDRPAGLEHERLEPRIAARCASVAVRKSVADAARARASTSPSASRNCFRSSSGAHSASSRSMNRCTSAARAPGVSVAGMIISAIVATVSR